MEDTGAGVFKIGKFEFSDEFWSKAFTARPEMTTVLTIEHTADIYGHGKIRDIDGNVTESRSVEVQADCIALDFGETFPAQIYYSLVLPREFDMLKNLQTMLQAGSIYYLNCAIFKIFPEEHRPVVFYEPLLVPVPQDEYPEWVKYFSLCGAESIFHKIADTHGEICAQKISETSS